MDVCRLYRSAQQHGATLLEATVVFPIILSLFFVATDVAQLHLKQAALGDITNEVVRDLELPGPSSLAPVHCSQMIRDNVTARLGTYGIKVAPGDVITHAAYAIGNNLVIGIEMHTDSLLGRAFPFGSSGSVTISQQAQIEVSPIELKCIPDGCSSTTTTHPPGGIFN